MFSKSDEITVILPARSGSERVKKKNTRPFAGFESGLLELKLNQLKCVKKISKIIVSTNDREVFDYAENFGNEFDSRVVALERPDELGRSSTPMSDFIKYAATLENNGVMLMTHVTHPFINSKSFENIINKWSEVVNLGYDSLITVTPIHKFIWDEKGPYNYDGSLEKWPRSQDIKPLFEINHGAYIIPFDISRKVGDRVGNKPFMYELPESQAMDIDWEDQFNLLEDIALGKKSRGMTLF